MADPDSKCLEDNWNFLDAKEEKFSYMSLALTQVCNLKCTFCYVGGSKPKTMELPKLYHILDDAISYGLKRIQLSGGEPLLYEKLFDVIKYLRDKDVEVLLVTNSTNITPEIAKKLHDLDVNIGVSLESIVEDIEDSLTDVPGTLKRKLDAIDMLIDVGYTKDKDLNIILTAMQKNKYTILDTWKWALSKGIKPVLNHAIPSQKCGINDAVLGQELRKIMVDLKELSGESPVLSCDSELCDRIKTGVHVNVEGYVQPCSGVELRIGNLNEQNLKDIWESDNAKDCRQAIKELKGTCGTCESNSKCYGCRGVAYAVFKDMRAPDPSCWRFEEDEVYKIQK